MYQSSSLRIRNLNSPSISSQDRSSSKKFYQAVYKLIDHDAQCQHLQQYDFINNNHMDSVTPFQDQDHHNHNHYNHQYYHQTNNFFNQNHSTGQKIQYLLKNDIFNWHLDQKMRVQGYYQSFPIVKIQFIVSGFISDSYVLDKDDIFQVFNKFGKLHTVLLSENKKIAYALFKSYRAAYVSAKFLDGLRLHKHNLQLLVSWLRVQQYQQVTDIHKEEYLKFTQLINCLNWEQHQQGYLQAQINQINFMVNSRSDNNQNLNLNLNLNHSSSSPNLTNKTISLQGKNQKQNKFTCRYEIQIQNQKDFQVARRIIGTKGCNMKKIIEDSIQKAYCQNNNNYGNQVNANQLLKLRLRGKGSGYKQGPQQMQSQDNLHLCVSAKDQKIYLIACQSVQKLLNGVYSEYSQYTKQNGKQIKLRIKKIDIGNQQQALSSVTTSYSTFSTSSSSISSVNQNQKGIQLQSISENQILPKISLQKTTSVDSLVQKNSNERVNFITNQNINNNGNVNFLQNQKQNQRLSTCRINQLLQMRNKARRQLNFLQADRIRNYLRNCGVCLIDQKGRRGRATDVTTWKYLY